MSTSATTQDVSKPGQLTAMISSTAIDLPEHRAAVKEACLACGVFPIGMEHLPARDASGITVSLEMVDKADLYLGIYAFRYGWVPDGKDISITEMEFDHAVERKNDRRLQEILIFTAHNKHPFTAEDIEADKEAQLKLRRFKQRACTGRVRNQFQSVEELRRRVSDALHEFKIRQSTAITVASTDPNVPATQLGSFPRLDPFFGRTEELQSIHHALESDTPTWGFVIEGAGGMGKTTLAVHVAHQVPQGRFQHHLFVSAKSQDLGPDGLHPLGGFALTGWLPMLNEIARLLGLPDIAKATENQRPRLLHEALACRRVLLILDNLETFTRDEQHQMLAFLGRLPRTCKAILTTRVLYGHHRYGVRLSKIDRFAALLWMDDLATTSPVLAGVGDSERLDLYHRTGGNPLMLRWVVSQLGHGSCRKISDALKLLTLAKRDDNPLRFIFDHLLPLLGADDIRVLATLSYPTEPIPVAAIAEISQLDLAATQAALDTLINHNLVVPDEQDVNHALVPMVAEFIRLARPEVVKETGHSLEERAYALIMENGKQEYARFPILEDAWPSIVPALALFLVGNNERLQTVCVALDPFLEFEGRWDERIALCEKAETRAMTAGDYHNAGWRAQKAGHIHVLRRQVGAVLACAERAIEHWNKAQASPRERATAISLAGSGHHLEGDYSAAINAYNKSLELHRSLFTESVDVSIVLNTLGNVKADSGDLVGAQGHYFESLCVALAVGNIEGVAVSSGNLAELALQREEWSVAETLASESLSFAVAVHRQELIAYSKNRLAEALLRQEKEAEALTYVQCAVDIFTHLGLPDLAKAQAILAECEAALGGTSEA